MTDPAHDYSLALAKSPSQLAAGFSSLQTRRDVADLLEVRERDLLYYGVMAKESRYRDFEIEKRNPTAGHRTIREPVAGLKAIQQKLLQVFSAVYQPPPCNHGFVADRSVATNAYAHEGAAEILNVDLVDFFDAVNFGRVWGLLQSDPYSLPREAATIISQLCVHENGLPQGAPTSPVVSNMVAWPLDRSLERIADRRGLTYTRYADDLSFSSNRGIPQSWVSRDDSGGLKAAGPLRRAVEGAGFVVNDRKTRLQRDGQRKEVTGLVVNERVNVPRTFVREVRAMLHAWDKYGEDAAQEHWEDPRDRFPGKEPHFQEVVRGKLNFLAMVRGMDDEVYDKYYRWFCKVADEAPVPLHKRPWNHLLRPEDAVWVIQSDAEGTQGTGFFLAGHGFVTCEHVIELDSYVFPPKRPGLKLKPTEVVSDRKLDLALLTFEMDPPSEMQPRYDPQHPKAERPERVLMWGYPDYNPGTSLWRGDSKVAGTRRFDGVSRLTLTNATAKGMSGGPALDPRGKVVGVLATNPHLYNSVIPISEIFTLEGKREAMRD